MKYKELNNQNRIFSLNKKKIIKPQELTETNMLIKQTSGQQSLCTNDIALDFRAKAALNTASWTPTPRTCAPHSSSLSTSLSRTRKISLVIRLSLAGLLSPASAPHKLPYSSGCTRHSWYLPHPQQVPLPYTCISFTVFVVSFFHLASVLFFSFEDK